MHTHLPTEYPEGSCHAQELVVNLYGPHDYCGWISVLGSSSDRRSRVKVARCPVLKVPISENKGMLFLRPLYRLCFKDKEHKITVTSQRQLNKIQLRG